MTKEGGAPQASPHRHSDIPRGAIFITVIMKLVSDGLVQFLKPRIRDSKTLSRDKGDVAITNMSPKALDCVPTMVKNRLIFPPTSVLAP